MILVHRAIVECAELEFITMFSVKKLMPYCYCRISAKIAHFNKPKLYDPDKCPIYLQLWVRKVKT